MVSTGTFDLHSLETSLVTSLISNLITSLGSHCQVQVQRNKVVENKLQKKGNISNIEIKINIPNWTMLLVNDY